MSYPDSGEGSGRDESSSFGRRTCLRGLGGLAATAGAAGALSGTASAATTRHGIEFDRVVNAVDDLGLDPNGNEPIQWKLNNADQEGALFVFPEGEYLITGRVLMLFEETVGIVGQGDVRFTVPERYNDWAVIIDHGQNALFENVDIDLRADGATPGCRFAGYDTVEVHDVEMVGRGVHPNSEYNNPDVNPAFSFIARDSDADVLAENVVARNRGLMGAYNRGNGRTGVWIGRSNKGTVTMRNCHFSGFPNNGLYTSRTTGVVQVEGGVFRNNDIAQVRLGSEGSYVKDALIEVDPSSSESPNFEDAMNARGVRIESGPVWTAGVTVENCDIRIADGGGSLGAVVAARPGGMFDVVDTRIKVDANNTAAVLGRIPDGGWHDAPPRPHRARLKNVSVTGDANRGAAIDLRSRPDSMVRSCCVQQHGNNRDAVRLVDSSGSVVRESTLNVSGQQVRTEGTNASVWGNSTSGSCPSPGNGGSSTSGTGGSGSGDGSSDDGSNSNGDSNSDSSTGQKRLEITGYTVNPFKYSIEVSGEINGTDDAEAGEEGSGGSVSGWVGRGTDTFTYSGRIERLVVRGKMTVRYRRADGSPNVLKFGDNHTGRTLGYSGQVTGSARGTRFLEASDTISNGSVGDEVEGVVGGGGWWDSFHTDGTFHSATLDDFCDITVTND